MMTAEQTVLCGSSLSNFKPGTSIDIYKIIIGSPSKSCQLDPIPNYLLKECIDLLLPVITNITNLSLLSGIVPHAFKSAVITPLIRKTKLSLIDQFQIL